MREYLKKSRLTGPLFRFMGSVARKMRSSRQMARIYKTHKRLLEKNLALKGAYTGKRFFILATGPSINRTNLALLKGELVITVSNFFVHPQFKDLAPEFHIFPSSHKPISAEQMAAWFQDAEKFFVEGQKVFVSATDREMVEKFGVFKRQQVYYYIAERDKVVDERTDLDLTGILPEAKTAPQLALYIALYLGSTDLYLLGCDHNWSTVPGQNGHFYDEKDNVLARLMPHSSSPADMQSRFRGYHDMWQRYREIRQYTDRRNIKVSNATPDSMLDIFPRTTLEAAINSSLR